MSLLKEDNGSTMTDDHRFKLLGCFDCRGQFHHSKFKATEGGGGIGTWELKLSRVDAEF